MSFTQLFYDISGTQNRKDQNFLTRTFFLIAILRYPTFSYCFYYIATFEPSHFCEIFTKFLVISEWIYLGLWNFLRLSLTSVGISWWRNFWNPLHRFTTGGRQTLIGRAKNEAIKGNLPLPTKVWQPILGKWFKLSQKFLRQQMAIDVKENFKKYEICKYILSELANKRVKNSLKFPLITLIGNLREIFTLLFASSDRIYLEIFYFLKFSFTSIAIGWWRIFWDNLNHLPTIGRQTLVGRGKNEAIKGNCL